MQENGHVIEGTMAKGINNDRLVVIDRSLYADNPEWVRPASAEPEDEDSQFCPYCTSDLTQKRAVTRFSVDIGNDSKLVKVGVVGRYVCGAPIASFYKEVDFDYASGTFALENDYDVCNVCKEVLPRIWSEDHADEVERREQEALKQAQGEEKGGDMVLYLRTEIVDEKPERELEIPVLNAEIQHFNDSIQFLRKDGEEWDEVTLTKEGEFVYQGEKYDFCFAYPRSMKEAGAADRYEEPIFHGEEMIPL